MIGEIYEVVVEQPTEVPDAEPKKVSYKLKTLSGFALMHNMGGLTNGRTKTQGEIYRDLIFVSLVEPKLTKQQIEETFEPYDFNEIGISILQKHKVNVQDFQKKTSSE